MAERKQPPGPATGQSPPPTLEQRLAALEKTHREVQAMVSVMTQTIALHRPVLLALGRLCEAVRTNNRAYRFYQSLAKRLQGTTRGPLVDVVEAMRED